MYNGGGKREREQGAGAARSLQYDVQSPQRKLIDQKRTPVRKRKEVTKVCTVCRQYSKPGAAKCIEVNKESNTYTTIVEQYGDIFPHIRKPPCMYLCHLHQYPNSFSSDRLHPYIPIVELQNKRILTERKNGVILMQVYSDDHETAELTSLVMTVNVDDADGSIRIINRFGIECTTCPFSNINRYILDFCLWIERARLCRGIRVDVGIALLSRYCGQPKFDGRRECGINILGGRIATVVIPKCDLVSCKRCCQSQATSIKQSILNFKFKENGMKKRTRSDYVRLRRQHKKISELKEKLKESDEQLQNMQALIQLSDKQLNANEIFQDTEREKALCRMWSERSNWKRNGRYKWSSPEIRLCVSVCLRSKKAYEVLRESMSDIPCIRSISDFVKRHQYPAGIHVAHLTRHRRNHFNSTGRHTCHGILSFDECSIDGGVIMSTKGDLLIGFCQEADLYTMEDVVMENGRVSPPQVTKVWQTLYRSLDSKYRMIGPYLYLDNITSNQLRLLVTKCIISFGAVGFSINVIVCDGCGTNRKFVNAHCTVVQNPTKFSFCMDGKWIEPRFRHPVNEHEFVWLLYDPSHMMKNSRNWLLNADLKNGEKVYSWKDIRSFYNSCKKFVEGGQSSAFKLPSAQAINPRKVERMRVKYAKEVYNIPFIVAMRGSSSSFDTCEYLDMNRRLWDDYALANRQMASVEDVERHWERVQIPLKFYFEWYTWSRAWSDNNNNNNDGKEEDDNDNSDNDNNVVDDDGEKEEEDDDDENDDDGDNANNKKKQRSFIPSLSYRMLLITVYGLYGALLTLCRHPLHVRWLNQDAVESFFAFARHREGSGNNPNQRSYVRTVTVKNMLIESKGSTALSRGQNVEVESTDMNMNESNDYDYGARLEDVHASWRSDPSVMKAINVWGEYET